MLNGMLFVSASLLTTLSVVQLLKPEESSDSGGPKQCRFEYDFTEPEKNEFSTVLEMMNDEKEVWPLDLACKPESFGYSKEEAEELFEDVEFKTCSELHPGKKAIKIDKERNLLEMNCNGKYVLGPGSEKLGEEKFTTLPTQYTKPVKLEDEEYALGTCDTDSEGFFETVEYWNRLKPKSLERALKSLKGDPINIAMVVLDSVSRRSFYRKLPKTVDFLNGMNISVFDFKIQNVMGEFSADSFMPTFFGDVDWSRLDKDKMDGDRYYEKSIWKLMHENV
jgi:hypothetical protein